MSRSLKSGRYFALLPLERAIEKVRGPQPWPRCDYAQWNYETGKLERVMKSRYRTPAGVRFRRLIKLHQRLDP